MQREAKAKKRGAKGYKEKTRETVVSEGYPHCCPAIKEQFLLLLSNKAGKALFRSPKITFYRKGTITLHGRVWL